MTALAAFWHVLNLFAPAFGVGVLAAMLAKLLWPHELRSVRWVTLTAWAVGMSALVLLAGLVVFGRDGRMATYAGMVVVCALTLWWTGFRPGRQRP